MINTPINLPILTRTQKPLVITTSTHIPPTQSTQVTQATRRRRKIFFKQKLMSIDAGMILRNRVPEEPGSTIILELIGRIVSIFKTPTPMHPAIEFLVHGEGQEPSSGSRTPLRVEYWGGAKETESNFSVLVGKLCRFIGTVVTKNRSHEEKSLDCTFLAYWVIPDVPQSDMAMYRSELKKTSQFISNKET